MNKKQMVDNLFAALNKSRVWYAIKKSERKKIGLYKANGIEIKKLTKEQKNEIDSIYKKYGAKYTYDTHIMTYSVTGKFDARIMPETLFRAAIEPKLNRKAYKTVLPDKAYFELYMPTAKFPETIIKNIDGCLYDGSFNLIEQEKAAEIVKNYDKVVVKPTKDSGQGRGVTLVETSKENPFNILKKDYIMQKVFIQHPTLTALNETSVNCIRLVTLFMDNQVHLLGAMLKIGGAGEFADNTTTMSCDAEKGRMVVGIDINGKLHENGFYASGKTTNKTHNGKNLSDCEVPCYKNMVEEVIRQHKTFPAVKFVAWDVTVTEDEEVVIMEYNTKSPGVQYIQYTNGALFGELTEKVLKYVKNNR